MNDREKLLVQPAWHGPTWRGPVWRGPTGRGPAAYSGPTYGGPAYGGASYPGPAYRDPIDPLLARAVAGVIRNAEDGELPLFAWTLGLSQPAWSEALEHCFPELAPLECMPERRYAIIGLSAPAAHGALVRLLLAESSHDADPRHARWLAHCVASAAMGSRHLWEDMGLAGRDEVSALLRRYFGPLYRRNTGHIKWKRFLFDQLDTMHGASGPDCSRCAQFTACHPGPSDAGAAAPQAQRHDSA